MNMLETRLSHQQKVLVIIFLVVACCSLTVYYHHVLQSGLVVSHFYYIPIILSALWWRFRGVSVAIILAAFLVFSGFWFRNEISHINDFFRASFFVCIALILALLSERIHLARTKLQENEEKLQQFAAIVSSSNDAIISIDLTGQIISWNKAAERIYGYAAEEVMGKSIYDLLREKNHEQTRRLLRMLAAKKDVEPFEAVRLRKDGTEFQALITMSPIQNAQTDIIGSSIIIRDVTKRREMENKLLIASQHLEQQVRIRTRQLSIANRELLNEINRRTLVERDLRKINDQIKLFSYRVLHDLKSPSVNIHGLASLLNRKYGSTLGEKGREICGHILKNADQVAVLVDKVNQFISTRELSLELEPVRIEELFTIIAEEFAVRSQDLRISITHDESDETAFCDRLSIVRALRNLVENAMKYGGKSLTEIHLGFVRENEQGIFSVTDNGCGIKPENQQHIFNLFHRDRHASVVDGTGLGLTIVKEVAEMHGGTVWLTSAPGKGTTFSFSIAPEQVQDPLTGQHSLTDQAHQPQETPSNKGNLL